MSPMIVMRGLDALYYSQIYRMIDHLIAGVGGIFCFHRVTQAGTAAGFAPNADLEIRVDFLEELLRLVRKEGWDVVTLDEVRARLLERRFARKFVCFTIDDVYQDTLDLAFPLFRRYEAPFTAFITTGIPDRSLPIWWLGLERILVALDVLWVADAHAGSRRLIVDTPAAKRAAYRDLALAMRYSHAPAAAFDDLCQRNGLSASAMTDGIGVTWEGLKAMSDSGLMEIGAHTVSHPSLADLSTPEVEREMMQSRRIIEVRLGCPVRHFAFPYGHAAACGPRDFALAAAQGFATAVTTRKRVLVAADAVRLHALPRLVLSGRLQKSRYARVFMSGALGPIESTMLWLMRQMRPAPTRDAAVGALGKSAG